MYTIGQLAKSVGVNIETIRYYERLQLIQQPVKPHQGYRKYPEETLAKVLFIKRAQDLGFTLTEISSLVVLSSGPCREIQHLAEHKLTKIQQKITDLQRLEESLRGLIVDCKANCNNARCPIIESLVPHPSDIA